MEIIKINRMKLIWKIKSHCEPLLYHNPKQHEKICKKYYYGDEIIYILQNVYIILLILILWGVAT